MVVKTVTDSDLLFTATGMVELFEENFILLIQKRISDNEYISRLAEETNTGITLFINDIRVATSHKDANEKYDIEKDGKQTPTKGHPVFIAQHATACCCRGCLNKWYHIPKDRDLNEKEINFIKALLITWIEREYNNR